MSNNNYSQKIRKLEKSENEWKNDLNNLSFQVLRNSYTERPFTGEYNLHFEKGSYNLKDVTKSFLTVQINTKVIVDGLVLIKLFQVQLNMLRICL